MEENTTTYRQRLYIIAVHPATDKFAIENSIDEAKAYVEKFPDRKAVIVSNSYRNDEMQKIAYNQVMNFKKGQLRLVDKKNNENQPEVLEVVFNMMKNGLIIIHDMQTQPVQFTNFLNWHEKQNDIIIHRNYLIFHPAEVEYINQLQGEAQKLIAKGENRVPSVNIILRLHVDDAFKFNKDSLMKFIDVFGENMGYGMFLCQYILLKKRLEYRRLLEEICKEEGEIFENYIDPYHFKKESSNFVYYNVMTMDIVGADEEFLQQCQNEIIEHLKNGTV